MLLGTLSRYTELSIPIKVLQLFCWPTTPFHDLVYPVVDHTPLVAGGLPIKLWLLGNGQQIIDFQCYQNLSVRVIDILYNKDTACSHKYVAGTGQPLTPDLLHPITVVNLIN